MQKLLIPLTLILAVATPMADWRSLIAVCLAVSADAAPPAPKPAPNKGNCDNCNGTGRLGDGTVSVPCPECDGTGKRKTAPAPRVRGYGDAYHDAKTARKPLVVGVGCDAPKGDWQSVRVEDLEGFSTGVTVSVPDGDGFRWVQTLPVGSTASDVLRVLSGSEVRQQPRFFQGRSEATAQRDAETHATGPWLPDSEQRYYRTLWEQTGVEFPQGGKFYRLKRVSQRLVTVNNVESNGIHDEHYGGSQSIHQQLPWVTPAGLHWSPKEQWDKVALAVIPGPVNVWREYTQVLNSLGYRQPQPRISWSFPEGTLFAEMLLRRHNGQEFAFEVRERSKGKYGWDSGTTYRPDVADDELGYRYESTIPPGKLADFGVGKLRVVSYEAPDAAPRKLVASRRVLTSHTDHGFVPHGYLGHTAKCITCHGKAGESTSYGATAIPGADSIVSWHPFTMDTLNTDAYPRFDTRWPLRILR